MTDHTCGSFTCYPNTNTGHAECVAAFDYNIRPCAYDSDCVYWTLANDQTETTPPSDIKLEKACMHTYNTSHYCEAASGSELAINYINAFKKVMNEDQGKCHSYARRNSDCWKYVFHDKSHIDDLYAFIARREEYNNWPNL
jgi:hypothetical protein